jgi:hypothetical protein
MRVDIARALSLDQPLIVFDEFTSVVDREIAKVSAYASAKPFGEQPRDSSQSHATMTSSTG